MKRLTQMGFLLNPFRFGGGGGGTDPNFSNVSLLLHLDGMNGSTTFTDNSGSPKTLVASGNAQISTAQSKFGGASAVFDGVSDSINVNGAAPTDLVFGTGDFTIELFVYRLSSQPNTATALVDFRPASTQGLYPTIYVDSGNLKFFANSADRISGGAVSATTWHHVALARASGVTKLFLNGTQTGSSYSDTNNYSCGTNRPAFAASGFDLTMLELAGYLDEVRITKGVARYTANFTPPSVAFPNS